MRARTYYRGGQEEIERPKKGEARKKGAAPTMEKVKRCCMGLEAREGWEHGLEAGYTVTPDQVDATLRTKGRCGRRRKARAAAHASRVYTVRQETTDTAAERETPAAYLGSAQWSATRGRWLAAASAAVPEHYRIHYSVRKSRPRVLTPHTLPRTLCPAHPAPHTISGARRGVLSRGRRSENLREHRTVPSNGSGEPARAWSQPGT